MKTLELNDMEKIIGGDDWSCYVSAVGLISGAFAVGALTGGIGLVIWGVGMGSSLGGMMLSCTDY